LSQEAFLCLNAFSAVGAFRRQRSQLGVRLRGFRGSRMALDEQAKLRDGRLFFVQLQQRQPLRSCAAGAFALPGNPSSTAL